MSAKRVSQPVNRYGGSKSQSNTWTAQEKRILLNGFKKFGHTDTLSITKTLPNKSPAAIKNMINNLMMAAKRSTKPGPIPPIDLWLEQAPKNDTNALISQALLFISMFERQPATAECDGCDLRAAYDYIYRMTQGYPTVELPKRTKRMVYKVISKTVCRMRSKNAEKLLHLIRNLYKSAPHKDYTRRKQIPHKVGPSTLINELNTFMVPSDQLCIT